MNKPLITYALSGLCGLFVSGCAADYKPLSIQLVDEQFIARGVIDETTPNLIRNTINQHPAVKTLVLEQVPGSVDDDANLSIAREIRRAGLNTVVPANGLVASGGTDLFLAGNQRTITPGACVGVHSWGTDSLFGAPAGSDVDRRDPVHQLYLSYYREMGIAAEFYWFTLEAAPVDDIYFMSASEINHFKMTSKPLTATKQTPDTLYQRCLYRLDSLSY